MSKTCEHLFLPGEFVEAGMSVRIEYDQKPIGEYGVHAASQEEMEDGIMFRVATLLRCGMDVGVLLKCRVVVETQDEYCVFAYDPEKYQFVEK